MGSIQMFPYNDLEDRAGRVLESDIFLGIIKENGKTYALWGLDRGYVEVAVRNKIIEGIEYIHDTNRIARYLKIQTFHNIRKELGLKKSSIK